MSMDNIITSAVNPGVKFARKLLRSRKARDANGLAVIEGYRAVSRALAAGVRFRTCYYASSLFLGGNEESLLRSVESSGGMLVEVSSGVLERMSYRDRPEGIVAVIETRSRTLADLPEKPGGLYLVAEDIEKPGNLGAMLRSLDGAGADGLILCGLRSDIYNPNVVAASTGALFSFPLAEATKEDALRWLRGLRIPVVAATPEAEGDFYDTDLRGGAALVVGAEQYGLSSFWRDNADLKVAISMAGSVVDSLNVATAAAVMLFEAARQRRGCQS